MAENNLTKRGKEAAISAFAVGVVAFLEGIVRLLVNEFIEWRQRRKGARNANQRKP